MLKTDKSSQIIIPDWQVPDHVKALSTKRTGGVSQGAFNSNNLALHVEDNESDVLKNRALLASSYALPSQPFWLNQTHTTIAVKAGGKAIDADASFSQQVGEVCVVMTADCLPVLLCDKEGKQVAAIHAGWRGLVNGIIESTLEQFSAGGREIIAWLGPAIGPNAFEVGVEVKDQFVKHDLDSLKAFRQCTEDKWLADIYKLARMRLENAGVDSISGGDYCTFTDEADFFSYRRDGVCGRMASLVWLDK